MTELRIAGLVSAGLVMGLVAPSAARARDVAVEVEGCADGVLAELRAAVSLELGTSWRVVSGGAPLRVVVSMVDCDAVRWTLRVADRRGDVLLGPDELRFDTSGATTRPRIAALWVAERLPQVLAPPSPSAAPSRGTRIDPPSETASAGSPARLSLGAGMAGLSDAERFDAMLFLRVGGAAQVLAWLSLGGSLEGGALFEPDDHRQPTVRLCAEPQITLALSVEWEIGVGPKACFTISRHAPNGADTWFGGAAVGGLVRVSYRVDAAWDVGIRADGDGWARGAFVLSSPDVISPDMTNLPWVGVLGVSLEARLR